MTRMRLGWLAAAGAVLAAAGARAADPVWRPAAPARAAAQLGRPEPLAAIDRPVPLGAAADPHVSPVAFAQRPAVVRAQAPEGPPPPPPPPTAVGDYNAGVLIDKPLKRSWWDRTRDWMRFDPRSGNRNWFESDHAFDFLASPVSSPFWMEDPRSLTEVKPLFIYDKTPDEAGGGHNGFLGVQLRLALTERLSIVMNKLGVVYLNSDDPLFLDGSETGFAEIWVGPKYTFIRNECSGTVVAGGVTFQIPAGSDKVFQDTGKLTIDPYITAAQSFGRLPGGFGSFNILGTFGYAFSTDDERTEYTHLSAHLDYNIANLNKFYPFIEATWVHTTKRGNNLPLTFEGADIVNFGSSLLSERDLVTLAGGMRYKFSECVQTGLAVEFPLTNRKDLADFRVTLDLIFRY